MKFDKNYMMDPNSIILRAKNELYRKNVVIGVVDFNKDKNVIYLSDDNIFGSNVSSNNIYTEKSREYLINNYKSKLTFKNIIKSIDDIKLINKEENSDISLEPNKLDKNSLINIVK